MRRLILSLSVLLTGAALSAQPPQPAAPPPLNPNNPVDRLLMQWEQATKNVQSLSATISRKDTDKVLGQVKDWSGFVEYLAPNLVRLQLTEQPNQQDMEYYLLRPGELYEYKSAV